jgi:GNAT superfamily N-acetyltransferase
MQFKFYDEVDSEQANQINLICHNEPGDAHTVARIRKGDPFCSPWFRMYAVEGDKVIAQVGAQYPLIETTEGPMKAGFIEAVAGMPSFARQGYAKALMKRVHGQMVEDGIDIFMLTTSRILVAYDMYPKLGYHEVVPLNWGIKRWERHPATDVTVKARAHPAEPGDELFKKFSTGKLGFVRRPKGYPRQKCSWGAHYSKAITFSRDGKPIGYALIRQPDGFLNIRELVCPDPVDMGPCLRALESRFKSRYVTRSLVTSRPLAAEFSKNGFESPDSWGMFMAMDAKGKLGRKGVERLLGIDTDMFQMFAIDTY